MPGRDLLGDARVHRLDDAGGLAHVVDLGRALDRALPVDEAGRVGEAGVRQVRCSAAKAAAENQ